MSRGLFAYPQPAAFGRPLPKSRIYAFGKASRRLRDRFAAEVAQIVWAYKLAPETINLPPAPGVAEIQVFAIHLKPGIDEIDHDLLRCIDKAIGFAILFEVTRSRPRPRNCPQSADAEVCCLAAHKRPSDAVAAKWVVEDYFAGDWLPADTVRAPLPVALNLGILYEHLLRAMMPVATRPGESLADQAQRASRIAALRGQCRQIETRLHKEKQFNRKVQINAELRAAQTELGALTD